MKIRLLHISAGNLFGGVEDMLLTFAKYSYVCPDIQQDFALCFDGCLSAELHRIGSPVHLLGKVKTRFPWTVHQARRNLRQWMNQSSYDVAICHSAWPHALFGPVVLRMRTPLVYWAHDIPSGKHWIEWWAKRTLPDLVLSNSHFTGRSTARLFPNKPHTIYCPVEPLNFTQKDQLRSSLRQRWDTPQDAVVILLASRLETWKGHHLLLEGLKKLDNRKNWTCWIVAHVQRPAEDIYLKALQSKLKETGMQNRIRFIPNYSNSLLAASDIYCQPNTSPEPFGIAFIKALYAGVPVVTTNLGGLTEIIEPSCGLQVQPTAEEVADALQTLMDQPDLYQKFKRNGPVRAKQLCDPQAQLAKFQTLMFGLMEKVKGPNANPKYQSLSVS
ncbi:MAG: glycosyltransferase family 4 protein [Deltaproteobacteria bacterium]|nr:glycosyltransferase family 4 protein [Deltaproteobacteria bacterium]